MNGAWPQHDTLPTANGHGHGFSSDSSFDPQMLNQGNPQFSNPQYQQPRSGTPSQFPYTPQQLVPSKRPRDDGPVNSPRQPPSQLSLSRSQTPQGANFPGNSFQNNNQQGQALQPPNAYQHLQQHGGSNNATPSPTLSNSQYRPPGQQPGMAISPPPDANGRGTPQSQPPFTMASQMGGQMGSAQMNAQMAGQSFSMPGSSMPSGFTQNYGGVQTMGAQGPQYPQVQLTPNLAQRQAALHQMSAERNRARTQQTQAVLNPIMMQQAAAQQSNMGTPTRPPGMPNMQNPQRVVEERGFLAKVAAYMAQLQRPFEMQPVLAGRPISLYILFHMVMKGGFSRRISQMNQWPAIARQMNFPPEQLAQAGSELHQIFERNLGQWEAAYCNQLQQRSKMNSLQQAAQMGGIPPGQPGQQNMSPQRPMGAQPANAQAAAQQQYMAQLQQRMAATQAQAGPSSAQMTPVQANASLPTPNGWSTPQSESAGPRPPSAIDQHRKSASRQVEGSPVPAKVGSFATPPPPIKPPPRSEQKDINGLKAVRVGFDPRDSTNYVPYSRLMLEPTPYGGILVDKLAAKTLTAACHNADIPGPRDLGALDLQAVSLSLQSGIAVEVRYALDILAKLTGTPTMLLEYGQNFFELAHIPDLLEVLLDCADDQIASLIDGTEEVADIEFDSYEETSQLAKLEIQTLQDIPDVGTLEYNNDRTAERLIAVTSILRNLSFPRPPDPRYPNGVDPREDNTKLFIRSRTVKFLSTTIRLLGTRVFLRSHLNVQDLMKDLIVILSNLGAEIVLPSEDDAYNFLQFILAFAPGPNPIEVKPFRFASYKPSVHKYYPAAIDAFAKLLARDEPNRTYFKQIFVNEVDHEATHIPVHQQYELLTRAFGMAIAVIPDCSGHEQKPLQRMDDEITAIAAARKPTISQGMLTADILSILVPTSHPGLAKAWLRTPDSWACMLFRVVSELAEHDGTEEVRVKNRSGGQFPAHYYRDENYLAQVYITIVSRSLSMLKRLAKKALDDTAHPAPSKAEEEDETNSMDKVDGEHGHLPDGGPVELNGDALLDDLVETEISSAADFLPLSDSIFYGIFANTKEIPSSVLADYIALGDILH